MERVRVTEQIKLQRDVTELKKEVEDLEESKNSLLDWTDRQTMKCKELQAKLDEYNEEFTKKHNILDQRNKEQVQKEQVLIRRELEFQKLLSEAQSERNNAEAAKKEVTMARNDLASRENSLKERIEILQERESKVDASMSYIQSVFKTIEKLKV